MTSPLKYAPAAWDKLNGLFAVYKPSGIGIKSLVDTIKQQLAADLNSMEQRPQKSMVLFKPSSTANAEGNDLTDGNLNINLKPVLELDWFDHPLVQGPRHSVHDFVISLGQTLDGKACGIQVVGVGMLGSMLCEKARKAALPRTYRARGYLGVGSLSATGDTKITDRSTWGHVTAEKLHRVLNHVQGAHRNSCLTRSGIDLASQAAYELAANGILRPYGSAGAVIIDLKLVEFDRPRFTIDVTCINEACQDIRHLIHEIGLILKTTAICTKLQRQLDGPLRYDDDHTLLVHQVNANSVIRSIEYARQIFTNADMWRRRQHFTKQAIVLPEDETDRGPALTETDFRESRPDARTSIAWDRPAADYSGALTNETTAECVFQETAAKS